MKPSACLCLILVGLITKPATTNLLLQKTVHIHATNGYQVAHCLGSITGTNQVITSAQCVAGYDTFYIQIADSNPSCTPLINDSYLKPTAVYIQPEYEIFFFFFYTQG